MVMTSGSECSSAADVWDRRREGRHVKVCGCRPWHCAGKPTPPFQLLGCRLTCCERRPLRQGAASSTAHRLAQHPIKKSVECPIA
eukprot:113648-Chlamydomonas_euryale.AAC.5